MSGFDSIVLEICELAAEEGGFGDGFSGGLQFTKENEGECGREFSGV